jgi:rubrerythrin
MGIFFSGSELVNLAIEIEKNGLAFYSTLAQQATRPASKQIFTYLAEQEERHRAIFEGMQQGAGKQPLDALSEEYDAYLRALVDSTIFTDLKAATLKATQARSEAEALEIGIKAEKDSILFYQEMRGLVRQRDRTTVGQMVAEERSHLLQLTALRKELAKV